MNATPREIRANILRISHGSGHGHIPTCFSVIESLCAVYSTMRHDPQKPEWTGRDRFVLSKGHAALGYYAVMSAFDYFPIEDVHTFGAFDSNFGCHADRLKVPGVEVSTGSLGHGIGVAAGMALAAKIARSDTRVYTLIGDGESNEGSVWEAIMVAVNGGLDNLTVIYDANGSQGRCLPIPNPAERFAAFGCDVAEVDGHDIDAMKTALQEKGGKPRVVVAKTVKGWGARTLSENFHEWHRRSPNAEELRNLLEEVDAWAV
ncbi:MAG: transketolase [Rhodospirillales bacterium]|nr:transketolase [Rhodospirillales bacterium]MCW9039052.1 transketolase [Rhodospirillales bacterium]